MIKNLNKSVSIPIEGTDKKLTMNFADKRFLSRLLKLVNRYKNFDKEIAGISEKIEAEPDDLAKADMFLDELIKIEEGFKKDINECFGFSVTDLLFGEGSLPDLEDYEALFTEIAPYMADARKIEAEKIKDLQTKYGLNRVSPTEKQ